MARRAYADAAAPKADRAARRIVRNIREEGWQSFTERDAMRLDRQGPGRKKDVDPALTALEDGDCIRSAEASPNPQGGRPQRLHAVNPGLYRRLL